MSESKIKATLVRKSLLHIHSFGESKLVWHHQRTSVETTHFACELLLGSFIILTQLRLVVPKAHYRASQDLKGTATSVWISVQKYPLLQDFSKCVPWHPRVPCNKSRVGASGYCDNIWNLSMSVTLYLALFQSTEHNR